METTSERLGIFMGQKGLNANKLSVKAGLSNGLLNKAINHGRDITADTILKIVSIYPDLNVDWLITGRGEMLKTDKPEGDIPPNPSNATIIGRIGPYSEPEFVLPFYKTSEPPTPEPDVVSDHPDTIPQNIWKPGDPLPKRPTKSLLKNTSENKPAPIFSGLNLEHTYAQVPILYNGFASAGLGHAQEGISIKGLPTAPIPWA